MAAVSGANTSVFTIRSTGTSIVSDVELNFTSIFFDKPFWTVDITSTVYVPYGKFVDDCGHVNSTKLNEPSDSVMSCSKFEIVPSGAKSLMIKFSFEMALPYTKRGSPSAYTVLSVNTSNCSAKLSVGVTAKYIQQDAYNESANTFALDIGTYLRTGFHNLVIAMCVSNFGGSMQLEGRDLITLADINKGVSGDYNPDARLKTEPWPLPLNFRIGVAMDILGGNDPLFEAVDHRVTMAIDGNHPNDNNERLNIGGEYSWQEAFFVRAGYKINYDVEKWTFGAGVKLNVGSQQVSFDYALVDYYELGKVSRFSLELRF